MKHKLFALSFIILTQMILPALGSAVCAAGFESEFAEITDRIKKDESVSVAPIYDEKSGDITSLGDHWRTQITARLSDEGIIVKTRKDLGLLQEELDMYGSGNIDVLAHAGSDVVLMGTYTIFRKDTFFGEESMIHLVVKALRARDGTVIGTIICDEPLPSGWEKDASFIKGNVYNRAIEAISPRAGTGNKPVIKARLDRNPACYPPGMPAKIFVETEPGVHLYILGVAADYTVCLFYPNMKMPDQSLPTAHFCFPPQTLDEDLQLVFYPLKENEPCQESIKVIASRKPIDFSFLPVPENQVYAGAKGGDMKKVLKALGEAKEWNDIILSYWVGPECK